MRPKPHPIRSTSERFVGPFAHCFLSLTRVVHVIVALQQFNVKNTAIRCNAKAKVYPHFAAGMDSPELAAGIDRLP